MDNVHRQFFALLRSGLWDTPADAALFSGPADWDAILTHAARQTVTGLVAAGVASLPAALRPPAPVADKLRGIVTAGIRSHALLNRTLTGIVELLRSNGIRSVLLKGQGVAANYAEPVLRICGDIDLYTGREDYVRAGALVRGWNAAEGGEEAAESIKHYHFVHGGVKVELHRIAEQLPLPWRNAAFQRWTCRHLHGDRLRTAVIGDTTVFLPPVNFDALYIFNHAWHHFSQGGGIGLRQLCDWVRYLHTFRDEIDRTALRRDLRAFGLWRPWQVFSVIAVDTLGLPREEYPFYTGRYVRKAARVMKMIEAEGNFGFCDVSRTPRPGGYVAGKLHSLRWMCRRYARLFPLLPAEITVAWGNFLYIGIRQVVADRFTLKRQRR